MMGTSPKSLNIQRRGNNTSFRERQNFGFFVKPLKILPSGGIVAETGTQLKAKHCNPGGRSWLIAVDMPDFSLMRWSLEHFSVKTCPKRDEAFNLGFTHERPRSQERPVCAPTFQQVNFVLPNSFLIRSLITRSLETESSGGIRT